MNRNDIMQLVITNLKRTVVDLEDADIAPDKAMSDMGATSLDIVEVVSTTMRKLRVKVPRDRLNNLTCLNDLVDLLTEVVQEQQTAVAS